MHYCIKTEEDSSYYKRIVELDVFGLKKARDIEGTDVLDLGAHVGFFSLFVASLFDCKIYAYEPETSSFNCLRNLVEINKLESKINLYQEALCDGNINILYLDAERGSFDAHSIFLGGKDQIIQEVIPVTPSDVFKRIKREIGYLKVNCEGGEISLLKYLYTHEFILKGIHRISLELHPGLIPTEFHEEIIQKTEWLKRNFSGKPLEIRIATNNWVPYSSSKWDCLKINTL